MIHHSSLKRAALRRWISTWTASLVLGLDGAAPGEPLLTHTDVFIFTRLNREWLEPGDSPWVIPRGEAAGSYEALTNASPE